LPGGEKVVSMISKEAAEKLELGPVKKPMQLSRLQM